MNCHKEYCIYCIDNGGTPFILQTFKNFEAARIRLMEMVDLEEERGRAYLLKKIFLQITMLQIYEGNILQLKNERYLNGIYMI